MKQSFDKSSDEDDEDSKDDTKETDVSQSSRWSLAVPFIGKDVPSRAAEFACPEVLIGLSVLAFNYEGMRARDFRYLVTNLKERMRHETGPVPERPSRVLLIRGKRVRAQRYYHWNSYKLTTPTSIPNSIQRATQKPRDDILLSCQTCVSTCSKKK